MTKTHIIYIPFTGVGKHQYKGDDWFRDRIEIFKNYTLKSLLNQTNQDFVLWLSFRSEDWENPICNKFVKELQDLLGENRVCTSYNGLIYWDDKRDKTIEASKLRLTSSLIRLSLKWFCDITVRDNDVFTSNCVDWVYLTRIDSDDMFHKDVVQLIQDQEPFEGALTLSLGTIYNKDTGEVAEWNPLTNPPFHTLMFKWETFFDPDKHLALYEGFKSHEDIAKLKHKVLWRGDNRQDRLYCVLTHNPAMHISTTWDHPFKGKPINKEVLKDYGI